MDLVRLDDKDVMIGNWVDERWEVSPNTYRPVRVTASGFLRGENWYGIPITPIRLIHNGFKELEHDEYGGVYLYDTGSTYIKLVFERSFDNVTVITLLIDGHSTLRMNIQFIHELQNALKLLGINMEIEL